MVASVGADARGPLLQRERRRGRGGGGGRAGRLQGGVPHRRGGLAGGPRRPRLADHRRARRRRSRSSSPAVGGGMRPKLEACVQALAGGVRNAHIVDGRRPHSLLLELFTDKGSGTKLWPLEAAPGTRGAGHDGHLRPQPGRVRPGRGHAAVGRRGQRVPRLPGRHLGGADRALPPGAGGGGDRPGRAPDARGQPLLHRARHAAGGAAVRAVARRQGVPVQLGRRGDRVRAQARPPPPARAAASW